MKQREFFCHASHQEFSQFLTRDDEGVVVCPHCGSERAEERPIAFYPVGRGESA